MKTKLFVLFTLLALVPSLQAKRIVLEGQSNTLFGDYRVESFDSPCTFSSKDCMCYLATYNNSDIVVKIVVWKEPLVTKYLVLSDKLSVQYVNNQNYLGVEKLENKFSGEGYSTIDQNMDRLAYFHQKVIRQGKLNEMESLLLIVSYFPQLIVKGSGDHSL
ncbi:MAG: hypothetical protein MUE37_12780 [Bacteroidales bacterium]|nr:hypothetical protein [Bacteroidales bacterium]